MLCLSNFFITAIFILSLCNFWVNSFIIAIFCYFWSKIVVKKETPQNTQKKNIQLKPNLANATFSQHQKLLYARSVCQIIDLARMNEKSPQFPYVPSGLTEGQKREFTTCFVLSPKKDKFRHALSFCKIMIMTPISSSKVNIFRKNQIPSWFSLPKTFDFFIIRTNLPSA